MPPPASTPNADLKRVDPAQVEAVLDATVRPLLKEGGGEVKLVRITDEGVVQLTLVGACRSCPSSAMAVIMGIERELMKQAPNVAYLEFVSE